MPKGDIRQFIDHKKEQFADSSVITVVALLQQQQHIPDEYQRNVSRQRVVGKTMTFRSQVQQRFAGLEEDFEVPPLPINPQDFFL